MDKKRILIVDDEVGASRMLQSNLEQTDHYVVLVENSTAGALAAAEHFQPELVLMDVVMPGLDGGELAQRFQDSPALRSVPIVFLTAAATKAEVFTRGGRIGGLPFLAKPVDMPELIACIEKHIRGC